MTIIPTLITANDTADWTVDPQTGPCHVTMWTTLGEQPISEVQVLGLSRWEDVLELVAKHHGRRLTYDLFDVDNGDGTTTRYRAYDVAVAR